MKKQIILINQNGNNFTYQINEGSQQHKVCVNAPTAPAALAKVLRGIGEIITPANPAQRAPEVPAQPVKPFDLLTFSRRIPEKAFDSPHVKINPEFYFM